MKMLTPESEYKNFKTACFTLLFETPHNLLEHFT